MADNYDGIKLFKFIYEDITYNLKNQFYKVEYETEYRTETGEAYQGNNDVAELQVEYPNVPHYYLKEITELIKNNKEIKNLFKIILENLKVLMSNSTIKIQEKKSDYFEIITINIDLIEKIKKDVVFKLENASFFQKRKLNKYIKYCDQILELLKEIESSSKEEKKNQETYDVFSPIKGVEYATAPPSSPTGGKRTRKRKSKKINTKKYKKINKRKTRKYRK